MAIFLKDQLVLEAISRESRDETLYLQSSRDLSILLVSGKRGMFSIKHNSVKYSSWNLNVSLKTSLKNSFEKLLR